MKAFIDKYAVYDPEKLVPKARNSLELLQRQKELEDRQLQELIRASVAAKQAKLEAWRRSLKVGVDTYCGPIIEARPPMYKLAIIVPLQGYPSEVWAKAAELFPPDMANCRNTNGRISPLMF